MNKLKIKNKLFYMEYGIKYKLAKIKYPEIESICSGKKYSPSFLECAAAHDYLKKCIKEYNKNCGQIEEIYQDVLYELARLINNLKYNPNILEILYYYSYIYYNGYLSVNNEFKFDMPTHEIEFKKSLSVFNGQGVCRNVGDLFSDLLHIFDIYSFGIITDRQTFESEEFLLNNEFYTLAHGFTPEFEHTFEDMLSKTENGTGSTGNHFEVIAFIKGEGWRLLDPSAIAAYKITKKETQYPSNMYLRYWQLFANGEHSLKETVELVNILKETYLKVYSSKKVMELQDKCIETCEKNKTKIKTFHNKMYENITALSNCIPEKD